ncbi:MAG: hypothetical protein US48_C0037G0008 [Candidatus Levybacteria bacterium GW2011_GWA2_37_36]|nr:MAG: hypothetical protein US43_C0044G0007 [Candidatus Levybacteria bacterium GW2011_GWA1_37_16]KKQ32038.1 MAG: hypothetical protein US48_C0037G0008 [Candidatus Levybacteria bacterium GW2011_GWA2_37_36]
MNKIYETPLLISLPDPFPLKNFRGYFTDKEKVFKRKIKNGIKKFLLSRTIYMR